MRNVVLSLLGGLVTPHTPLWPKPGPPAGPAHVARPFVPVTWTLGVADREASGLANLDTVLLNLCNDTDDMVAVGCGETTNDFIVRREICLGYTRPPFSLLELSWV